MRWFIEMMLLPNADIGQYFIWQKLYQQIHLALAESKCGENASKIGVSFPEYNADKFHLGTKLRLFAEDEQSLQDMQCDKWLRCLRDYVQVKPIATVPENLAGYARFKQVKLKGNKEKLARRRAKRKGEPYEQALAHYVNYKEQQSKLPYINMTSLTNGNRFRLLIEKQLMEQPQTGFYSCYGLNSVPTFGQII